MLQTVIQENEYIFLNFYSSMLKKVIYLNISTTSLIYSHVVLNYCVSLYQVINPEAATVL